MTAPTIQTSRLAMHIDHGVLVAKILDRSLMHPAVLREVCDKIRGSLHLADAAVVIDCSELTYNVTSQFLGSLVALRKEAISRGVEFCVCGVRGALREAFEIVRFDKFIPCFDASVEVVEAFGQFTDRERTVRALEKAKRESIAQYCERDNQRQAAVASQRRKPGGFSFSDGSGKRSDRRVLNSIILLGSGLLLVLLAVITLAYWWTSSSRKGTEMPATRTAIRGLAGYSTAEVCGTITCRTRGIVSPDGGARIYAWPVALKPEPTFSTAEALVGHADPQVLPTDGLYRCQTSKEGSYRLRVHSLGEFFVLIVSGTARRSGPIADYELAALSTCFDDPREVIGDRSYCLTRCSVASKKAVTVDWQFGHGRQALGRR